MKKKVMFIIGLLLAFGIPAALFIWLLHNAGILYPVTIGIGLFCLMIFGLCLMASSA